MESIKLQRRIYRLNKIYRGLIPKPLETWDELQFAYNIYQDQKNERQQPFGVSILDLQKQMKPKIDQLMQEALNSNFNPKNKT